MQVNVSLSQDVMDNIALSLKNGVLLPSPFNNSTGKWLPVEFAHNAKQYILAAAEGRLLFNTVTATRLGPNMLFKFVSCERKAKEGHFVPFWYKDYTQLYCILGYEQGKKGYCVANSSGEYAACTIHDMTLDLFTDLGMITKEEYFELSEIKPTHL